MIGGGGLGGGSGAGGYGGGSLINGGSAANLGGPRDDNGSGADPRRWPARSACLACWLALVALAKKCGSDLNDNPVEHDKQKRT
jgi:hypothetical protein